MMTFTFHIFYVGIFSLFGIAFLPPRYQATNITLSGETLRFSNFSYSILNSDFSFSVRCLLVLYFVFGILMKVCNFKIKHLKCRNSQDEDISISFAFLHLHWHRHHRHRECKCCKNFNKITIYCFVVLALILNERGACFTIRSSFSFFFLRKIFCIFNYSLPLLASVCEFYIQYENDIEKIMKKNGRAYIHSSNLAGSVFFLLKFKRKNKKRDVKGDEKRWNDRVN